jgi:hypothetical protein
VEKVEKTIIQMQNGFLYLLIRTVFDNLKYLNLVELLKVIAVKHNPQNSLASSRISVDTFIVLKWLFIAVIWITGQTNCSLTFIVWYLIVANIYTYFYYHIWTDDALNTSGYDNDKIRRRFVNLILAVAFSDFCFAYLYRQPYSLEFSNTETGNNFWFSVSNSLAANYDTIKPISELGNSVAMIQLIFTFIFVTIIISRSIPQKN